jgi:hypothetical protein
MTGPEHYREAERLQAHAQELLATGVYDAEESLQQAAATEESLQQAAATEESLQQAAATLADAQIHATLAVASVLGLSASLGAADLQAWRDAAATKPQSALPHAAEPATKWRIARCRAPVSVRRVRLSW